MVMLLLLAPPGVVERGMQRGRGERGERGERGGG